MKNPLQHRVAGCDLLQIYLRLGKRPIQSI
jgi:hypothetical protein